MIVAPSPGSGHLERIAGVSVGLMGRTPDYKNVTFAGWPAPSPDGPFLAGHTGASPSKIDISSKSNVTVAKASDQPMRTVPL